MNNLQVGTKLVVTSSSPVRCSELQEGEHLTITAVLDKGKYRARVWNIGCIGGVLEVEGLRVYLKVMPEPVAPVDTTDYKRIALMQHLSCAYDDVESTFGDSGFEVAFCDYLVLTDDEADEAFEEALDSVLDEVILPDLDEALQCYFDRDAWKRDASYDGRGHHLSPYDGCEEEVTVNGVDYYIYRTN